MTSCLSHKNRTVPSFRPIPSTILSSSSSSIDESGQDGISVLPGRLVLRYILSSVRVWAFQYAGRANAVLGVDRFNEGAKGFSAGETGDGSLG